MWTLLPIALRNVSRNGRRTLITLLALLLGVGVMVSVRGLLNGLQLSMVENITQGQTGALQIHRTGYMKNVLSSPLDLDLPADEAFLKQIRQVPHVTGVAPRILFGAMINLDPGTAPGDAASGDGGGEAGGETLFMVATAVDPKAEFAVCAKRKELIEGDGGRFARGELPEGLVITHELAQVLAPPDAQGKRTVDLAQLGRAQTAVLSQDKDGALSAENAQVVGLLQLNAPGERKVGLLPLALAQRLLKMEGRATELVVAVDDIARIDDVAAGLRARLGPDYEVHRWDDAAPFFKDILFRQNFLLSFIAAVFLVLMLLGVANTMLMSVLDRTREIGTMMAVGVRRSRILALFLLEAAAIGALGGVVGGAAGTGVVAWLNVRGISITMPGSNIPFDIHPFVTPGYLAQIVLLAGLGALVFAVYPAWRASRLRPVEALAGG